MCELSTMLKKDRLKGASLTQRGSVPCQALKLPLRVALKFAFKMFGVLYMIQISPIWMLLWPVMNLAIVDMVMLPLLVLKPRHLKFVAKVRTVMSLLYYNSKFNIISGAIPTPFSFYGETVNVPFILNGIECTGNESSVLQCAHNQTFGEVNKYRDEPGDEINMAGVKCERKLQNDQCLHYAQDIGYTQTEYSETNCSYLDVRLTFRLSASSGLVEICNENNTWSVACSNVISEDEVGVVCRQLGFNGLVTNQFTTRLLGDEKPRISEFTRECIGNETTLLDCIEQQELLLPRERRGLFLGGSTCDFQAGILCGGIL